jgi:hypothetical protein
MFYRPVDLTDREAMVSFLSEHFRYHASYALNVKLPRLELSHDEREKAYEVVNDPAFRDAAQLLLHDWESGGPKHYLVGFDGRSSGYLVLYGPTGRIFGYVDSEGDIGDLQDRVRLVQSFDGLGDRLLDLLKRFCKGEEDEECEGGEKRSVESG